MSIDIGLTLLDSGDGNYVRAAAVLYVSMRLSTGARLRFHIVHDQTLDPQQRERLSATVARDDRVFFYNINEHPEISDLVCEVADQIDTRAVYWRVFLADLLPLEHVILCDADLIILCDIARVWTTELGGHVLSGVIRKRAHPIAYHELIDTPPGSYFRCGFLNIDLRAMREDSRFMQERVEFLRFRIKEANRIVPLHEQSLFNYFFNRKCLPMNVNLVPLRNQPLSKLEHLTNSMSLDRCTVLDIKGWKDEMPHDVFYWGYLLMTPWRGEALRHLWQADPS